nr:hypothetical protein [Actinoplanes sp. DH11]
MLLVAPFAEGLLSWFDYKGEANNVLRELVGRAPARIRSSRGRRHYELIEAAHTVLAVSSFFDALQQYIGDRFEDLRLTDEERERIARGETLPLGVRNTVPMPDAMTGFEGNLPAVKQALSAMHTAFRGFTMGLDAAQGMTIPATDAVVGVALRLYRERYVRLAVDVPEFGIWSQLDEHAATRAAVHRQTETLTGLERRLTAIMDGAAPAAVRGLRQHYAAGLSRPLWRSDALKGLVFPTVEDGFVSPRFRLVVCGKDSNLGDESWWRGQAIGYDLEKFLTGHLVAPASTQNPLVILGHPGAGKSLLTEVLAARVPTESFTTIRVPLRRVDPELPIHEQVVAAVELATKERISWGDLCRASDTTKVVLLDGFDELVQATGVTQSHYIEQAATFQREEWELGRPVVVIITSRTLVMDRTVVREGTVVLKLEPFNEPQVERWTRAWNAANRDQPGFRPLPAAEFWRHEDLAGQPLLLLMLAVYAADAGHGSLAADDLSTDRLYRLLLDSFIRRQVREKAKTDLGKARFAEREADSRRDLAAVAFAMFNRRRQWVGEEDLGRDLEALHPEAEQPDSVLGEPVSRARRTVAAFFFVHVAQAGDETRARSRRSYEFLHATFAEYLVAEHAVELLTVLAEDWQRARRRSYRPNLDERVLRTLLSHQPLTNGEQVLPFVVGMIAAKEENVRAALREVSVELFRSARRRIQHDPYLPTPFDVVSRTAAYTANLVLLAMASSDTGVPVDELCGPPDAPNLQSSVRLWRTGLDAEVQKSFFASFTRVGERLLRRSRRSPSPSEIDEALLTGDAFLTAVLRAGWATFNLTGGDVLSRPEITHFQRDFHRRVVDLTLGLRSTGGLTGLAPRDERRYRRLADWLEGAAGRSPHESSLSLLALCLTQDASRLDPGTLDRILGATLPHSFTAAQEFTLPMALLAANNLWLIRRHPRLRFAVMEAGVPDFLLDIVAAHRDQDPDMAFSLANELSAEWV